MSSLFSCLSVSISASLLKTFITDSSGFISSVFQDIISAKEIFLGSISSQFWRICSGICSLFKLLSLSVSQLIFNELKSKVAIFVFVKIKIINNYY